MPRFHRTVLQFLPRLFVQGGQLRNKTQGALRLRIGTRRWLKPNSGSERETLRQIERWARCVRAVARLLQPGLSVRPGGLAPHRQQPSSASPVRMTESGGSEGTTTMGRATEVQLEGDGPFLLPLLGPDVTFRVVDEVGVM